MQKKKKMEIKKKNKDIKLTRNRKIQEMQENKQTLRKNRKERKEKLKDQKEEVVRHMKRINLKLSA